MSLEVLNIRLLEVLGLSTESAKIVMERIGELERELEQQHEVNARLTYELGLQRNLNAALRRDYEVIDREAVDAAKKEAM